MEAVWRAPPATPADVLKALSGRRPLAYTTVMTVMSRLYEKGLLKRRKLGRAYAYTPKWSKTELLGRQAAKAMRALAKAGGKPALSHFVDAAARLNEDELAALEREIARLRERR